jgi:chromosome segregation ATPase
MFLDQQAKMNACEIENQELQEHYDNSIHIDWIAEAAGEDPEYYRDVCCAHTLGAMIKENKELKEQIKELNSLISEYKDSSLIHNDAEPHEILETMEEYEEAIETRDDKIEELKEQNQKLREEINGDGWLKEGYKTDLSNSHKQKKHMVKEIVKLKQDIEKLVEKNEELKTSLQTTTSYHTDKYELLEEENKKLIESKQIEFTEENMKIQESLDGWMATLEEYKMLKVENKKLKEEIEKLNQLNDYAYKQINELTNKVTLSTID